MNKFDIDLMLCLNFDGGSVLDAIMWFASGIPNWIPLYILALYMIYRRHGWRYMLLGAAFIVAGVTACDMVCNLFKAWIPYLRPTHTPVLEPMLHTVNGYLGGMYGTVSGHASTTFAVFLLSSLMVRRGWFTAVMLAYALLVAYSRIYLGVHFPLQIIFGIILGATVGGLLWILFRWSVKRLKMRA